MFHDERWRYMFCDETHVFQKKMVQKHENVHRKIYTHIYIRYIKDKGDIDIGVIYILECICVTQSNRVLYVPQLKNNLSQSNGCASEKEISVIFEDDGQNIYFYRND